METTKLVKKTQYVLIIVISFAAVSLVLMIIIWAVVLAPETATILEIPYVVPPTQVDAPRNIQPGATCDKIGVCVPGYYCNADGVCEIGTAKKTNDNCFVNRNCAYGSYCSGSFTCQSGPGWNPGGPCIHSSDCKEGGNCVNSVCVAVLLPILPSCTPVFVYQLLNPGTVATILHINSVVTLPTNPLYFGQAGVLWVGCTAPGADLVPVYLWARAAITDYILSKSNVAPFHSGTNLYTIQNSGNPVLYIFSSAFSNTIPIYKLQGHSFVDNNNYHCTSPNQTSITQETSGQFITYEQYTDDIGIIYKQISLF